MGLHTFNFVSLQRWCRPVTDIQALLAGQDVWLPWRPAKEEVVQAPDFCNDPADLEFLGSEVVRREFGFVMRRSAPDQFSLEMPEAFVSSVSDALILRDNFVRNHYTVILAEGIAAMEAYDARDTAERMTETAGESLRAKLAGQELKVRFYQHDEDQTSQLEECVLLAHDNPFNFSHFLLQIIPRFQCLEQFPELKSLPLLIPQYAPGSFHQELIEPLVSGCQTTVLDTTSARCRRAIVPTLFAQGGYSREQLAMVDGHVKRTLGVAPPTRQRRLLISRTDAGVRRIINENELFAALVPLGFELVTLSGLPLKRQVELFQEADVIVAPHGAGNTNLIFAREGALFIEFVPRSNPHPMYWIIARLKGLRHARIVVDHNEKEDMIVDPMLVRRLVEQF